MTKNLLAMALLPLLLLGCGTTLTNLTATAQPRNPKNLYRIEYQWDTTEQTIKPDTIKPYVVIGFDTYEMTQTPKMTNRWEVLVPASPDKDVLVYKFKVDYDYARFGKPGRASKSSEEYKLYIK